jgi:hypothetical protein
MSALYIGFLAGLIAVFCLFIWSLCRISAESDRQRPPITDFDMTRAQAVRELLEKAQAEVAWRAKWGRTQ